MRRRIAVASRLVSGVTGTTTTILEHSRRLRAAGWEVHVFGEKLDAGRLSAAGAEPHFIPRWPLGSYFKRRLFAWQFDRELRGESSFDLVSGHGDSLTQDVLSLHNCVHAAHEAVHGRALGRSGVGRLHARILKERRFRLMIANSALMKRDVVQRFGVPADRVVVIHPGHDPARFTPGDREALGGAIRERLGLRPGDTAIGLITSGDFAKRGVAMFLRALGRLKESVRSRLCVLVVGQETRLRPYERLARAAGLGGRVLFLPPDPNVEQYYHALDLYVHPASFEEFGQSVQEAMACGVAVLTSRRVGAAELLPDAVADCVLEKPTEEALSAALERLVLDDSARRRLAEAGAEAARANTWDENFRRTLECYEALLEKAAS